MPDTAKISYVILAVSGRIRLIQMYQAQIDILALYQADTPPVYMRKRENHAMPLQPESAPTMLATCTMQSTLALRAMLVSQSQSQ